MNKTYRVIFNHATGVYQCVSELAKTQGKTKSIKTLAVAVGLVISGQAFSADIEITDGKVNHLPQSAHFGGSVLIKNAGTKFTSDSQIILGSGSQARSDIEISNQAVVESPNETVIAHSHDTTVTIDNATLNSKNNLIIGNNPTKSATVIAKNGAKINAVGFASIAYADNSTASVELSGKDTALTVNTQDNNILNVGSGNNTTATLTLSDNATVSSRQLAVGRGVGSKGALNSNNGTINIDDSLVVGFEGTGTANLTNSTLNIKNGYSLADKKGSTALVTSQGNTVKANFIGVGVSGQATLNSKNDSYTVAGSFSFGQETNSKGTATFENGSITARELFLGYKAGATGDVTLNNGQTVNMAEGVAIGYEGTGILTLENLTNPNRATQLKTKKIVVGSKTGSNGTLNINTSNDRDSKRTELSTDTLVVGDEQKATGKITVKGGNNSIYAKNTTVGNAGTGTLQLENSYNNDTDGKWYSSSSKIDTLVLGKQTTGTGKLIIKDGATTINTLIVGEHGTGIVDATNGWLNIKNNIERADTAKKSEIFLNGLGIDLENSQNNLFKGFTSTNKIELGQKGVSWSIHNKNQPPTVTINPNAVLTGNVGKINTNNFIIDENIGGFLKSGNGTLEIFENSKQFAGDLGIVEGTLKINGNYAMNNGETLNVILFDDNEDNKIDLKNDPYGKLVVTQKADISKGDLFVYADKAIENTDKASVWKDVVTAGTLVGKFKNVNDNSPLVDFYADYSDANKVHLGITAPNSNPPVTTPPVTTPPVTTPPVTTPPVTTPPVTTPPVTTPPVTTPPVTTPPVTTPPVTTPPVTTPPVTTPPVTTPPVTTPPVTTPPVTTPPVTTPPVTTPPVTTPPVTTPPVTTPPVTTPPVTTPPVTTPPVTTPPVTTPPVTTPPVTTPPVTTPPVTTPPVTTPPVTTPPVTTPPVTTPPVTTPPVTTPPVTTPPVTTPPVTTPPVTTPPVTTPPVTTPPVTTPPVTTPPVTTPPVTTPPVTTPPVTTPPVTTPPVTTPPVTTPPVTTGSIGVFENAVKQNRQYLLSDLAKTLDGVIDQRINNTASTATQSLANGLIGDTTNFTQNQLSQAVNQLQPLFVGSVGRIITDNTNQIGTLVFDPSIDKNRHLWAKAFGNRTSQAHKDNVAGYDTDNKGVIVGIDTPMTDKLNTGLAVAYNQSQANTTDTLRHSVKNNQATALLYADYDVNQATSLTVHAGVGRADIKGKRHIDFANTTALADYTANVYTAGLGVSHQIGTDTQNITPFAKLDYHLVRADGYTEKDAGVYNLSVDKQNLTTVKSTLGVRLNKAISPVLNIRASMAVGVENGNDSDIRAKLAGTDRFTTQGLKGTNAVGTAGLGVGYAFSPNSRISLDYEGNWRKKYDNQALMLTFNSVF